MSFAGGSGAVDEFGVGVGRPRAVRGAVGGPPFGQSGAGVREGAFEDLQCRDPPGAADGGQDAAPGADAAFLFAGVEAQAPSSAASTSTDRPRTARLPFHLVIMTVPNQS